MNVKQKIGLAIVAPLFAFSVGHTVMNKINRQQKQKEFEEAVMNDNLDLAISRMSMAKDAEFKAKLNIDSAKISSEQATELINIIQESENNELSQKLKNDILKYLKEE